MTLKKWRPFWSYDIEKSERWLGKLSSEGIQLTGINRVTRIFSFEHGVPEDVQYQIVYDKSSKTLPRLLEESSWRATLSDGNWKFMKNNSKELTIFPSREGIVKRNRLHFYVLAGLALFYIAPLLMMLSTLWVILTDINAVEPSPYWWITAVFFLQIIFVIGLAIYLTTKLKAFERKFFSGAVDVGRKLDETFTKLKFGWIFSPDLMESWLSEMSEKGNHLVRIDKSGMRFIFEKGESKLVSYVYDYQLKTAPTYADIHKGAGWKLKYISSLSFTKHSLWAQEYNEEEEIPKFTYDAKEKNVLVRKVVFSSAALVIYILAIAIYALWLSFSMQQDIGLNLFNNFMKWALIISLLSPIVIIVRTIKYAIRMKKANEMFN